jgi:hypothetical protein
VNFVVKERVVDCTACRGNGFVFAQACALTRCVVCKGRGFFYVSEMGVCSKAACGHGLKGGERKIKALLLGVMVLGCSYEPSRRTVGFDAPPAAYRVWRGPAPVQSTPDALATLDAGVPDALATPDVLATAPDALAAAPDTRAPDVGAGPDLLPAPDVMQTMPLCQNGGGSGGWYAPSGCPSYKRSGYACGTTVSSGAKPAVWPCWYCEWSGSGSCPGYGSQGTVYVFVTTCAECPL